MIKSFKDKEAEKVFLHRPTRRLPESIYRVARRKLIMLEQADTLDDLRVPPGNRLHVLDGNREGQYSIRINDQFRVCFIWRDGDVHEVEIVDYH